MKCSLKKTPTGPSTLELRIHGVRNTPPHELLRSGNVSLTPEDAELLWGDELAGFYRAKAPKDGQPDYTGSRVVEAYSWGRLARFTGVGLASKIADALVRTAWFLLMPFGLTNTAYWSRPLPRVTFQGEPADAGAAAVTYAEDARHGGDGAGRIRLFALVLTLYFVVTAAVVSLDLIAVQCFPADRPEEDRRICSTLPAFLDGLAWWTRGQRIALLAIVPLLGMGILAAVAYLGRTRYHLRPAFGGTAAAPGTGVEAHVAVPTLMIPNLWEARQEIRYNGWLHLWAAVAAVAAIIAWDGFVPRIDMAACASLDTFLTTCVPQFTPERMGAVWFFMMLAWVLGVAAVAGAAVETVQKSADNPDLPSHGGRPWRWLIALGAIVSAAGAGLLSIFAPAADNTRQLTGMPALSIAPVGLMVVMLVSIGAMYLLSRKGYDRRSLGWRGKGSAVFCTLALGAATILGSAVVGAAASLLQANLKPRSTSDDGMWRYGALVEDVLDPPPFFRLFGGVLLAVIIVAALVWGISSLRAVRAMAWNTEDAAVDDLLNAYGAARPLAREKAAGQKLVASRRTASLAHRAEAVVSLLAFLIFLGLVAALVLAILAVMGDSWNTGWMAGLVTVVESLGVLGLAAAGAAILALAVMSARPNSRPLALLWDLMCFMPKAAHPFGPPSYGERAVPEFAARIAAWLDGSEGSPPAGTGKVVISAHSLGAVIAVAALFHLKATRPNIQFERIGLLTYGTQLRPYFGRFFPELFGPVVLSTAPVGRTGLRSPGGPLSERESLHTPSGPACMNLGSILGPGRNRWINLYRKTDYLGFPVLYRSGEGTGSVDTDPYAQEMDPYTYQFLVVSHSDYLQTRQYEQAIDDVTRGLPAPQQ